MKILSKNRLMTTILAASLGSLSLSAMAAIQAFSQQQMTQRVIKANQQANAAEAAKATKLAECRKLLEQNKDVKLAECPALLEQDKGASESK